MVSLSTLNYDARSTIHQNYYRFIFNMDMWYIYKIVQVCALVVASYSLSGISYILE